MYSLALTAREVIKGNGSNVEEYRVRNAKLALHDLFVTMMLLLLGALIMSKDKDTGKIPFREMGQPQQLATKILMKSFGEFNSGDLLTSISVTPAFVSILGNAAGDFKDVISGDTDLEKFLRHNVRLMEFFPDMSPRK